MGGGSTDNFKQVVNEYSDIISFLRSAPDEDSSFFKAHFEVNSYVID